MPLLLTGATGFVGSHTLEALSGYPDQVRVLVRPTSDLAHLQETKGRWKGEGLEMVRGHLGERAGLSRACQGVDTIVHLAALTRARNEDEFRSANEAGTRHLLEAAAEASSCRRFIYVSSLAAAGPALDGNPVGPEDEPHPLTAYGRSKLAGEAACRAFGTEMEIAILRPPAVYGPRDRDLLPFFSLANLGLLPVPAGPLRFLQMIHVHDLAEAVLATISTEGARGTFHLADPTAYSWGEVVNLIGLAVGRRGRKVRIPQTVFRAAGSLSGAVGRLSRRPRILDSDKVQELLAPAWLCETERATEVLGFTASIPLEEGLRRTANWYREEGWLR